MAWDYAYTPYIWPSVFTVVLLLILVAYSWRRRSVIGALPFIYALLFGALWAAGSALEYAAVDLAAKITWVKFQSAWQLPAATAVTCFVLEYAWPGRWLTRRNLVLLSIVPLLMFPAILTDDLYHLIWRGFSAWNGSVIPQLGSLGWMAVVYSFGLVFLTLIVFAWLFLHSPKQRWPVAIMVAGHIGLRTIVMLDKADFLRSALPLDVLGMAYMSVMYAIALFGFRFFDPISLAHQSAIEQLHDGMLVLDPQGRVVSLNPATERILGVSGKQAKGQPVKVFLPAYPDGALVETGDLEIEINHQAGQESDYYILSISPLKDWRGMEAGRLLLLHDVTSRKLAEAALNKSQEIQRLIFEKSFDGISIYEERPDEDERILVDCNERYCQMAGRSKEELLAIQDTRVFQRSENPSEDHDRVAVMTETAFSGVFSWTRPDGKENFIEYKAAPTRVGDRFFTIGVDRDITESRQTQAQILEQQRALSMLQEREQLARELHDGLGQVLGYTGLSMEATRKLIADGKLAIADDQLVKLENIVADAHADVREYILNLRTAPTGERPFFSTLQHYLDGFLKNYGIRVDLSMGSGVEEGIFAPEAQVQVFRIIQEAFSNARKHAHVNRMHLSFEMEDSQVCIRIQDNGKGFDPTQAASEGHFGLRIMRERAEQLSGTLIVESTPGQGTCLTVKVPV